jgi:hypothetical protein
VGSWPKRVTHCHAAGAPFGHLAASDEENLSVRFQNIFVKDKNCEGPIGRDLPVFRERGVRRHSPPMVSAPTERKAGRVRHSGTAAQLSAVAAVQD